MDANIRAVARSHSGSPPSDPDTPEGRDRGLYCLAMMHAHTQIEGTPQATETDPVTSPSWWAT
jgi:hypothetical protein